MHLLNCLFDQADDFPKSRELRGCCLEHAGVMPLGDDQHMSGRDRELVPAGEAEIMIYDDLRFRDFAEQAIFHGLVLKCRLVLSRLNK